MRGIIFRGGCTLELVSVPEPTPGPGEVALEIKASAMCGSDPHFYRRPLENTPPKLVAGHEPCDVLVAVGPGVTAPHARIRARVMHHHHHSCTDCELCRSGWPQMCRTVPVMTYGADAHGADAPDLKAPADTLVPLDERLSFTAGAAISCGTEDEVIRLANNTPFGLASYFYTRDVGRIVRVAETLEYGFDGINEDLISTPEVPFGGIDDPAPGATGHH